MKAEGVSCLLLTFTRKKEENFIYSVEQNITFLILGAENQLFPVTYTST